MKDDKITILMLATNHLEIDYVRLDEEFRKIDEEIQVASFRDSFEFITRSSTRVSDLRTLLLRYKPHIIHFSGHGKASGEVILEDDEGGMRPMEVYELIGILRAIKDNIRLVVFNVCYSRKVAEAAGTAFDYSIGMEGEIDDESAIAFSGFFYRALAFGRSVREAFESAREHLSIRDLLGVSAPVLFVGDGVNESEAIFASGARPGRLESVIRRLIGGMASENDRLLIQNGVAGGNIIFDETDSDSEGMSDRAEGFTLSARENQIHVRINSSIHKKVNEALFPSPPGIAPPVPPLIFIGREGALEDVKRLLSTPKDSAYGRNVTVVRGWPGVGKTTLVGVIGRDPGVAESFPQGVLWTSLERRPNLLSEMARWGRALGTEDILRAPTLKDATAQLAALMRRRRMLLILDDVWETAHALPFVEALAEQCALLITTRMTRVAEDLVPDHESVYVLPVLTEESGLKLLRVLAPSVVEQHPDECRQLVCDLECLPLALHVAGKLLKSEAKMGWGVGDLIADIRAGSKLVQAPAPNDRIEGENIPTVSALLAKSTDLLDDFTRECFAFLGAFAPKPATFDLAAMKAVWEVDDPRPVVRKLVGHGLLEPVGSGRFQMHSILVNHAKSLCT